MTERSLSEVGLLFYSIFALIVSFFYQTSWATVVRTVWDINPAIAIFLTERSKNTSARSEVTKLVRSSTLDVLDIPEALPFLLGDKVDPNVRRDLKV